MMALVTQRTVALRRLQDCRGLAALAACLMLGACAGSPKPSIPDVIALGDEPEQASAASRGELEKATAYWGQRFAKSPRDLQTAMNYAKNLKAMGEKQRALAVLQQASLFHGQSRELAGEYGRLALDLDQVSVAGQLLAAADDPGRPDWRIISARGTVLAKQGKYQDAIPYYERALALAHEHPSILSNLALAHAMNGEPARAESMLRKAAATDRNSLKIRQNLALVLGLQGKYDEANRLASRDMTPENAAENTDYLRRIVKLEPKAAPMPEAAREVAQGGAANAKASDAEDSAETPHVSESSQSPASPISVAQWTPKVETADPMAAR
jgi:Flp pilus assembly protein TadD